MECEPETVVAAIKGYSCEIKEIDAAMEEIQHRLSGKLPTNRHRVSPAARRRMADAQRERWARWRLENGRAA